MDEDYSASSSAGGGGGKKAGVGKQHNTLPFWGNENSMNLNPLILANIQSSSYFKVHLFKLKTYHEVVDEIYYQVKHMEPWERGSRKTSGQTGMCGGVRGVGAGGIVSTAYCLLYKLYTLRLTRKQINGLLNHTDSAYIRALGFMYLRYTQPPSDLYDWYEDYLQDEEEIDVKAGGGQVLSIGQMVYQFMTKLDWFSTLFPRIPVPIQKQIEKKIEQYCREQGLTVNQLSTGRSAAGQGAGGGGGQGAAGQDADYQEYQEGGAGMDRGGNGGGDLAPDPTPTHHQLTTATIMMIVTIMPPPRARPTPVDEVATRTTHRRRCCHRCPMVRAVNAKGREIECGIRKRTTIATAASTRESTSTDKIRVAGAEVAARVATALSGMSASATAVEGAMSAAARAGTTNTMKSGSDDTGEGRSGSHPPDKPTPASVVLLLTNFVSTITYTFLIVKHFHFFGSRERHMRFLLRLNTPRIPKIPQN
ncbi:uncharacterized protein LOC108045293 isoform X3 [Drosophila rhopaloa]|uniref:Pre-mRNA-splicing factor 38 n=1 Tax=Drosophila rhopaloa TaxID=1041015 RepID=A0A6P4F3Z8_DRORH|nr:uncharacterized protein LOC108045293 isoform X3 [Drosophila rhopaloa]